MSGGNTAHFRLLPTMLQGVYLLCSLGSLTTQRFLQLQLPTGN
jgi:hypothetical protein